MHLMNDLKRGKGGAEVCLDMKKGRREGRSEGKQADGRLSIGIGIGREGWARDD